MHVLFFLLFLSVSFLHLFFLHLRLLLLLSIFDLSEHQVVGSTAVKSGDKGSFTPSTSTSASTSTSTSTSASSSVAGVLTRPRSGSIWSGGVDPDDDEHEHEVRG